MMKFRNYCVIIMGNIVLEEVILEISDISDIPPNYFDAGGVFIATFNSAATPNEIGDFLNRDKKNFMLFDLSKDTAAVNFIKKDIQNALFGFLKKMDQKFLDVKSKKLHELTSSTLNIQTQKIEEPTQSIEDRLSHAVENEDYVLAAKLRDQMNKKKKK